MGTSSKHNWIDNKLFEKVLKQIGAGNLVKILSFDLSEDVNKPGDGYASTILRARVNYSSTKTKSDTINLIIKLASKRPNVLGDGGTFKTELQIYSVVREMEHLFETAGEKIEFAPRILYYSQEPENVLVLEDVSVTKNFSLEKDRLNWDATKLVVSKLAKWHAASYVLDRDFKSLETFDAGLFNLNNDGLDFIKESFSLFTAELRTWDGFGKYVEKLEDVEAKFLQRGKTVYARNQRDGYNVLNHGDFHYKNMLFKRSGEQTINDVMFLDFQLSVWASPVIDLYYVLYMVADDETRLNHERDLVQFYHQEFENSVRKIANPPSIPSLLELNVEMLRNKFMEVVMVVCFLPYLYGDEDKVGDNHGDIRKQLFKNDKFQETVKRMLPIFLMNGVLQ